MVKLTMLARVADGLPLAEGLDSDRQGDLEPYKQQAKTLFKKLSQGPPPPSRMSYESGPYFLHYMARLVARVNPRRTPFHRAPFRRASAHEARDDRANPMARSGRCDVLFGPWAVSRLLPRRSMPPPNDAVDRAERSRV